MVNLNLDSAPLSPMIERVDDLPDGYLLTRSGGEIAITDEWRAFFAVLRDDAAHHLVVAESHYGKPQMFEMMRRMKAAGIGSVRMLRSTADVIKLLYSNQEAPKTHLEGGASNIEEFVNEIVSAAVEAKASDIHIESRVSKANIYFRVNGQRRFWREISSETAYSVGVVLYVHADAGSKEVSWNPEQVMDSAIEWVVSTGASYQLRFSSAPIYPNGGFHIVIRLLSMEVKGISLEALGYSEEQRRMLDIMTSGSAGIVLVCGPTNSGKSTTLQALMQGIYARRGDTIKMVTVEDPVEYMIPGACQISVGRKKKTVIDERSGSAFTTFLRGTLRQDPDVVMVGEIRDFDSAVVVKDLVLAGRKILATLHTYSALWAYVRLREIGVPWEILTMPGFIAGIVYQRLVPVLCPECSVRLVDGGAARLPEDTLYRVQQVVDLAYDDVRVRGDGCPACKSTGITGRTVCAEFVLPDRSLLRLLSENNFIGAEKYWRDARVGAAENGVTSLAHAIAKMKRGILSPVDIEDQIALLTADIVSADNIIASSELGLLSGK
jgi:type II secretory ATPase GspE/PulE/Tfp pilus assembly ATPase PilB-like protein